MDTGNRCLQALLRRGDIPLPASFISLDREKIASEFCCSHGGSSGSSPAPQPCGAALLRARQLQATFASWLCLAL